MIKLDRENKNAVFQGRLHPDWLKVPEPKKEEIFLHLWVGPLLYKHYERCRDKEFPYILDFTVISESPYSVQVGTVRDEKFVPSIIDSVRDGGHYVREIPSDTVGLQDHIGIGKQVMVRIAAEELKEISFYDFSYHFQVVGMRGRLPNCKRLCCRNMGSLRRFSLEGPNSIEDMRGMFQGCSNLEIVGELDTSTATDLSYMFDGCEKLEKIPILTITNARDISHIFRGCKKLGNLAIVPYTLSNDQKGE